MLLLARHWIRSSILLLARQWILDTLIKKNFAKFFRYRLHPMSTTEVIPLFTYMFIVFLQYITNLVTYLQSPHPMGHDTKVRPENVEKPQPTKQDTQVYKDYCFTGYLDCLHPLAAT